MKCTKNSPVETQRPAGTWEWDMDVATILRDRASLQPHRVAIRFYDSEGGLSSITHADLWTDVASIAVAMAQEELAGQPVLLSCADGKEFLAGFFATLAVGAVAVPLPLLRVKDRFDRNNAIINNSGAKWLLSTSSQIRRMREQGLVSPGVRTIATDLSSQPLDADWTPSPASLDRVAMLQYTSGSTAEPKGVMLSQYQLLRNCETIAKAFELDEKDVGFSWLPLHHDMGLIGGVLAPFLNGTPNVAMTPDTFLRRPALWLRRISELGATVSGGPDSAFLRCAERITDEEMEGVDLSRWRVAFTGSEPIRPATFRKFAAKFEKFGFSPNAFLPCFGLAESTLMVSCGPLKGPIIKRFSTTDSGMNEMIPVRNDCDGARELCASGKVFSNERVVIVDPESRCLLSEGSVGEIWIQSPSNALGYWSDPETTREIFQATLSQLDGNFLRTGDLGFLSQDQLWVTGRLKDLIIIRGVNYSPSDIESACERASTAIRDSAVIASSMEKDGRESLFLVAEAADRTINSWDAEFASIRNRITEECGVTPSAIYIVRAESLPRTSSGKLRRQACREKLEQNQLSFLASWPESENPDFPIRNERSLTNVPPQNRAGEHFDSFREKSLVLMKKAVSATDDLDFSKDLEEQGYDSVAKADLIHAVEKGLTIRLSESLFSELRSPMDIAEAAAFTAFDTGSSKEKNSTKGADSPPRQNSFRDFPEIAALSKSIGRLSLDGESDPYFTIHEGVVGNTTRVDGRALVNFASYNYLGLSGHPEVSKAAVQAIKQWGTSAGASRLISGNREVHENLETALAEFIGTAGALAFVGGHSTNETTIGHLFGPEDLILFDSASHDSIVQGARLSGARRNSFPHNDPIALERILKESRGSHRRVLVVIEGLFGIDGDIPDLAKFVTLKKRYECLLMIDEAHSIGTLGATGRGITEYCGVDPGAVDLIMGTLSKSLASCGGFVCGEADLIEYLRYSVPGFVFSVGMPPASAAAALAALQILKREPKLVARLRENCRLFRDGANERGLFAQDRFPGPVFSLDFDSPEKALAVSRRLFEQGINAPPILYPAVSETCGKIRFFISSTHSKDQIDLTLDTLSNTLRRES